MPLYTALCGYCGKKHPYIRKVADRNDTPDCCGQPALKVLDAPMVGAMSFSGWKGFEVPGAGKWLEDGASVKKHMRQNNLIPESEGAREAAIQRDNHAKADDKKLTNSVLEAIARNS